MDEAILRALNSLMANDGVAAVAHFLSSLGFALAVTIPLAIVLFRRRRYFAIASIALAMAAGDAANARIIKPLVGRERPCRVFHDLERPAHCGPGKAFASGHAVMGFAFLLTAAPVLRFGWAVFTPIVALVGLSRIVLGLHWPSDVAAGALFGAAIGGLFLLLRIKIEEARAASPAAS